MEAQTVNALPPVASHDETVRCLLAIELSKKSWIVAINSPLSDKIGRHTLEACDWKGLLERIERIRMRVARELNRPVEVISCYETRYDGFWLHRLLEAHGVRNYVIDATSVHVEHAIARQKAPLLRGRLSPARSRRCDHGFRRNIPLAVQLPGHSHRDRALPRQNVRRALARAKQAARSASGVPGLGSFSKYRSISVSAAS